MTGWYLMNQTTVGEGGGGVELRGVAKMSGLRSKTRTSLVALRSFPVCAVKITLPGVA